MLRRPSDGVRRLLCICGLDTRLPLAD